ncbi:hypothetical protein ACFV0T_31660 [Streptomyces sp. NPDC059582]|uniref:hypothetical protein n=1 Tax=Streptomyces sp. NPDC059582 TaxID=3346875 RepID=UPI0036895BD8
MSLFDQGGRDAVELALEGVLGTTLGVLQQGQQQQVDRRHDVTDQLLPAQHEAGCVDGATKVATRARQRL